MRRVAQITLGLICSSFLLAACSHLSTSSIDLIRDGKGLENFQQVGDANWRVENNLIVADKGKSGFLVTKQSYKNMEIRA